MSLCTCWVGEAHLRDIADLLTDNAYDAVLATPTEERSWQLRVSGGCKVPYWEQEEHWIVQCRPVDDPAADAEVWEYTYDSGELIGDTTDKALVVHRIRTRVHGIDWRP